MQPGFFGISYVAPVITQPIDQSAGDTVMLGQAFEIRLDSLVDQPEISRSGLHMQARETVENSIEKFGTGPFHKPSFACIGAKADDDLTAGLPSCDEFRQQIDGM